MGYYTRFKCNLPLCMDATPAVVIDLLKAVGAGDWAAADQLTPRHKFFEGDGWSSLLRGAGAAPKWPEADGRLTVAQMDNGNILLALHSSSKVYDHEIDKFLEWIGPYSAASSGELVGEVQAEDDEEPAFLVAQDHRIDLLRIAD